MFGLFKRNRKVSEKAIVQQPAIVVDEVAVMVELKQWHMDRIPTQRERYENMLKLWQSGKVGNEVVVNAYSQWMQNVMLVARFDRQLRTQQSQPASQQLTLF